MEFTQKRMASNIRFEFGETEMKYWVRDNSGERDLTLDYATLPLATRRVFERNNWLRNIGLIWCLIGAVSIGLAFANSSILSGSGIWLVVGAICLLLYRLTQTNYTVLDSENGSIWVMDDKQSQSILSELQSRRKKRLLDIYGEFSPNNDRDRELQKFDWLVKEKVLSREEANLRIVQGGGQTQFIDAPDRLLN